MLFLFFNTLALAQTFPKSPFKEATCFTGNPVEVGGYPSSNAIIIPFVDQFKNPEFAVFNPANKKCRADGHCIQTYEIDVKEVQLRPFDNAVPKCKTITAGTWFMAYNGQIPGPTIRAPTGHETLLRFNNKITGQFFKGTYKPCDTPGRSGRPFSVHLHGSASLAPFDGWAEDETCFGETKDYVYPNNRPTTAWYHDHGLHITAENAYAGMAGQYWISNKKSLGGCGEPYNLDNTEEMAFIMQDRVLDNQCQSRYDPAVHEKNLYGDINMVNGVPFPNMNLQPKDYRFRILNAAISRPFLVQLRTTTNQNVGHQYCHVIAADGGFLNSPIRFPTTGLLVGVSERYEVVCDFSKLAGQTLYVYNHRDAQQMKDVPYFCHSHLIAKINVANVAPLPVSFQPLSRVNEIAPLGQGTMSKVLSDADIQKATAMANAGQFHREFKFGRSMGMWTINGETWDTIKIAANDIGQNTWELWKMKSPGGWFHPVHVHLIDFYILKREGATGLREFERLAPKDTVYLGPSNTIYVIARFGAHKGDYMFHCHNLIHEDNDMMRAYHMVDPAQGAHSASAVSTPYTLNPLFNLVYGNYAFADPMAVNLAAKPTTQVPALDATYTQTVLDTNYYRIFYPTATDLVQTSAFVNPWQVRVCPIV